MSQQRVWSSGNILRALLVILIASAFGRLALNLLIEHSAANARRLICAANMKQIGLALVQYTQDNDGYSPSMDVPEGGGSVTWRDKCLPYLKSTAVFRCPSDIADPRAESTALPTSYGANHLGRGADGRERGVFSSRFQPPLALNLLSGQEQTIMLVDMRGYSGAEWNMVSSKFLPGTGRTLFAHTAYHRLNEQFNELNCLFSDGHTEVRKPLETLTPVNLWTRDNKPFTGQELSNAQAILKHAEDE